MQAPELLYLLDLFHLSGISSLYMFGQILSQTLGARSIYKHLFRYKDMIPLCNGWQIKSQNVPAESLHVGCKAFKRQKDGNEM